MLNHFDFKRTLKNRVSFFLTNFSETKRKIEKNDFTWRNNYLNKFLGRQRRTISQTARYYCLNMIRIGEITPSLLCVFYCFTYSNPLGNEPHVNKFTLDCGYTFDMEARSGILLYNEQKRKYTLFGMSIRGSEERLDLSRLMNGLLLGYRITSTPDPTRKLKSITFLDDNREKIKEGEEFRTYLYGVLHGIIRDSSVGAQMRQTYDRHLDEGLRSLSSASIILRSKRNYLEGMPDDTEPLHKKRRTGEETVQDIPMEETDEGLAAVDPSDLEEVPEEFFDFN